MEDKFILGCIGVICTTVIVSAGVIAGHDGALISSGFTVIGGIIGGIIGYSAGKKTPN